MSSPRMAKRTATAKATSHTTQCFAELLSRDPELSALRADYAQKPATKRRAAWRWSTSFEDLGSYYAPAAYPLFSGCQSLVAK